MTDDGELLGLVYTSYATTRFDDERLAALLTRSRRANARRDVTGLLLYRERRFLQALEGPADRVRDLVGTIAADPRHHDIAIVLDEPIATRRFPSWSMGFRPWTTPDAELPAGFADTFVELDAGGHAHPPAVRELLDWFRYRADVVDALDA